MAIVNIIKYDGGIDEFIWKYPYEEIGTWSQLIVNETQEAILVKDGKICDIFKAGKYTLDTKNIPILNKIINIPFGNESPFKVEIWFVNKRVNLDIKWGTPTPIQLQDPKYGIFIPVRSFGQFGIKLEESKVFFTKLIGVKNSFNKVEINNYFRGVYLSKVKDVISSYIVNKKISILEINSCIIELSDYIKASMSPFFEEYGISLINFFINDINVPEEDEGVKKLKSALAKRAEMDIVGYNYLQERSFDTLEGAAKNSSNGITNDFMGAGIGMAMGVGLGNTFNESFNSNIMTHKDSNLKKQEHIKCKKCGKEILKGIKFCPECGELQYKKCNKCGAIQENENAKFCSECGAPLIKHCSKCNTVLISEAKFCPECGAKVE